MCKNVKAADQFITQIIHKLVKIRDRGVYQMDLNFQTKSCNRQLQKKKKSTKSQMTPKKVKPILQSRLTIKATKLKN